MKRKSPLALATLVAAASGFGTSSAIPFYPPVGGFRDPFIYSLLRSRPSGPPAPSFGPRRNQRQRRKAKRQLFAAGARRSVAFAR